MKEIASIATTQYILDKYHLHALKKYGQNFIVDVNVIEKIVKTANINQECAVIEIGPGIGALTQILAKYASFVQCFEIDERFKGVYQEFFKDLPIEVLFQDFLTISLDDYRHLKEKYQRVVLVANLPYYITTQIIEKVLVECDWIDEMVVMVQKEVALKYSQDYKSPLTLLMQSMGKMDYMFTVSKNIFNPKPHVDSAILKMEIDNACDHQLYDVLKTAFQQRRKTIYNNLKTKYDNAQEILNQCDIDLKLRAEQLTLEDFMNIKNCLQDI